MPAQSSSHPLSSAPYQAKSDPRSTATAAHGNAPQDGFRKISGNRNPPWILFPIKDTGLLLFKKQTFHQFWDSTNLIWWNRKPRFNWWLILWWSEWGLCHGLISNSSTWNCPQNWMTRNNMSNTCPIHSGWWYTYPSENDEFVSWDHHSMKVSWGPIIPNIWKK